jgi:hypothetical protein
VNHLLDNLPETLNETGFLQSLVVLAIVGLAFGKVIALTARDERAKQFEILLFAAAVAVRFLASLLVYEFGLMEIIKDEDSYGWMGGVVLQGDWAQRDVGIFGVLYECTTPFFHPLGNYGYEYLIGLVFYLTNLPARLPAAVLSNVCGAATAVVVYRVGAFLFSEWVAQRAAWWTCLMPSLIIWAAQTIKEPIVILLEAICLYACLQLRRSGFSVVRVALCGAVVILLIAFRFYAAYIMAGVVVGSLLIGGTGRTGDSAASAFVIAAIVAAIMLGSGMMAHHMPALEKFDLRAIQETRDYTARTSGSGVIIDYDLQTPKGLAMSLLLGAANLLLAPFPWQLGGASLRLLLTLPEVVIWWWIVLRGLVPGMTWCLRERVRDAVPLLLFLLAMGTLYSIIFSNIGLGYRYRATLMPWLLIFAMVGVEQRWVRRGIARQLTPFPSPSAARPLTGHFAP